MDRSKYEKLVEKKLDMERQISDCNQVLIDEGNIGVTGSLVDLEGYPRADIDLYKVRMARQQINCLRNDYKELMGEIEKEIVELHSSSRAVNQMMDTTILTHQEDVQVKYRAFAKISQVDPNSPAFEAGLELGDEIVQFGSLLHSNTSKNLSEIASLVKNSENRIVLLSVLRQENNVEGVDREKKILKKLVIKLVPKQWSGHGLLGCRINPLD